MNKTNEATTIVYRGWITEAENGESSNDIFLTKEINKRDYDQMPLAELVQDQMEMSGRYLSLFYILSNTEVDLGSAIEKFMYSYYGHGEGEAKYFQHYSDITGYLWTDEDFKVGGHDILNELRQWKNQFCYMSVTYTHEGKQ